MKTILTFHRGFIVIALTLACGTALADGTIHAMGYLSPLKGGTKVTRMGHPKARTLLGAKSQTIPERWDSREKGWVTPVKDQGDLGNCWSFVPCAVLETQLLKAGKGTWDFSEKNLVNLNGWEMADPLAGGFAYMAYAYMTRWAGPVSEASDVYVGNAESWTASSPFVPICHVQNVVWIDQLDGRAESRNGLKFAIMEYGALGASMYFGSECFRSGTCAHYCNVDTSPNHAITVIGWDDSFPTNNFLEGRCPPGPGAWIIKNSWGPNWGDNGLFYVSFYDLVFGREAFQAYLPAGDDEDYDAVRGYDRQGPVFDASAANSFIKSGHDLQASVFTATWNEQLAAVGVWTAVYPKPYEISIYTNVTRGAATPLAGGVLACRQTGTLERAGFTTIHLEMPVPLADGDGFSVIYRQTEDVWLSNYVNSEDPFGCHPDHQKGNSYFGYYPKSGVLSLENATWFDGKTIVEDDEGHVDPADVSWAACIKVYTRSTRRAPVGDAPGEADSGTAYLADLAQMNATFYAETAKTFGSSLGLVGVNGRSLWTSWLAGFDPSSTSNSEFTVSITISNNVPQLVWTPNLGDRRSYTVLGRASLDPADAWTPIDTNALAISGARFFKVAVGQ